MSAESPTRSGNPPKTRNWLGSRLAQRIQRFARPQHRADRQQVLDHIGRTDAGQRALLVVARHRRRDLDDRLGRGELEFARGGFETGRRAGLPDPGQRRLEFARRLGRAVADRAIARPAAARRGGSGPAAPANCLRPGTARAGGTSAAPDRRCAAAPRRLPRRRARPCAIARARRWRPQRPRRARWRARTPASAAPAPAAGAARDSPSAARSMSGSCARCGYACVARTAKRVHRDHKSERVKKAFRNNEMQAGRGRFRSN